jgi:hypothetical protein
MLELACGVAGLLGKSVNIDKIKLATGVRCRDASGKEKTSRADNAGQASYLAQSEKIATTKNGWVSNWIIPISLYTPLQCTR